MSGAVTTVGKDESASQVVVQPRTWAKPKPRVLLSATSRWFTTARLALALKQAEFTVAAVCPSNHPLASTSAAEQIHTYNGLTPLATLQKAVCATKPDVILPCDDLAAQQLYLLYKQVRQQADIPIDMCELIERSLGDPECLPVLYARTEFMQVASREGIRVPNTAVVDNIDRLHSCVRQIGLPMVLKADGSSGGAGVRVVSNIEEAVRAFYSLHAPPLLPRVLKRAVVDRDYNLFWPFVRRQRPVVNAQALIVGQEATSAIACWKGEVLASLHFEVLRKARAEGHATVLRWVENQEMAAATTTIVSHFKLSGFHGFDFMLEKASGNAYLIEMNPRATQVGHLTLGPGHDLPAVLHSALSQKAVQLARKVTENEVIALFPQEWTRDNRSEYLQSAYHDVPWNEPGLLDACMQAHLKNNRWQAYWKKQPSFATAQPAFRWSSEDAQQG